MSVSLNPSSALAFNRPLTQLVKRSLTISNPNGQPVAFKVKTTAPKVYCVRPNSGRIEPGESIDVAVMLQPMKEEPPLSYKCKDKFLIQSTLVTPDKEQLPLADIWNTSDGAEESRVHQQKLRVSFLPPEGQTLEEEDEGPSIINPAPNGNPNFETARQYNGDTHGHAPGIPSQFIPQQQEDAVDATAPSRTSFEEESIPVHIDRAASPPPPPEPVDISAAPVGAPPTRIEQPTRSETPPFAPARATPAPPPVVPQPAPAAPLYVPSAPSQDRELLAKLSSAQGEIERLRALLAAVPPTPPPQTPMTLPTELRRRNRTLVDEGSTTMGPGSDVGATTYIDDGGMQPEGVPLQVVVIIALGVFITTYLFF